MDGDARGGAALSIKAVTGKPLKYVGVGEKIDGIELFHPDRIAQRILGMGDILTLVEKAQKKIEQEDAEKMQKKMLKGNFTLEDFLKQMQMMKKMGSMSSMLSMLPGLGKTGPTIGRRPGRRAGREGTQTDRSHGAFDDRQGTQKPRNSQRFPKTAHCQGQRHQRAGT